MTAVPPPTDPPPDGPPQNGPPPTGPPRSVTLRGATPRGRRDHEWLSLVARAARAADPSFRCGDGHVRERDDWEEDGWGDRVGTRRLRRGRPGAAAVVLEGVRFEPADVISPKTDHVTVRAEGLPDGWAIELHAHDGPPWRDEFRLDVTLPPDRLAAVATATGTTPDPPAAD